MNKVIHAGQIANNIIKQDYTIEQEAPQAVHVAWEINNIFNQLKACFPAWRTAIKSQAELDVVKLTWAKALIEAKVSSMEQIGSGMAIARQSDVDFFPSVGKFIKWCKEGATKRLNLPDPKEAFRQACNKSGGDIVKRAAAKTGTYELARATYNDATYEIFISHYNDLVQRALNGEDMTLKSNALEDNREVVYMTESEKEEERKQGEQVLADLMKINWAG